LERHDTDTRAEEHGSVACPYFQHHVSSKQDHGRVAQLVALFGITMQHFMSAMSMLLNKDLWLVLGRPYHLFSYLVQAFD